MEKIMKNKLSHILSIMLISLMVIFTMATSPIECHEGTFINTNYWSYEIDDEYLVIKIKTDFKPDDYVVHEDTIDVHFKDKDEYQVFYNHVDDDGNNVSRSFIVDNSEEPEIIEIIVDGEFVFETSVEDDFFVIEIEKDIIKYDNIRILEIYLYHERYKRLEIYRSIWY